MPEKEASLESEKYENLFGSVSKASQSEGQEELSLGCRLGKVPPPSPATHGFREFRMRKEERSKVMTISQS